MAKAFTNLMNDRAAAEREKAGASGSPEAGGDGHVLRRIKVETRKLDFFYGPSQALFDISVQIPEKSVTVGRKQRLVGSALVAPQAGNRLRQHGDQGSEPAGR